MAKRIMVYAEQGNSIELLAAAQQISDGDTLISYAFCIDEEQTQALDGYFDYIYMSKAAIEPYDVATLAKCLGALQAEQDFDAILLPATAWCRMLAPRVAMRLGVGLVADITAITHDNGGEARKIGSIQLLRPTFGGKLMAAIECEKRPLMASIRAGVFHYDGERKKATRRIEVAIDRRDTSIRLVSTESKPASADIRDSQLLVSGGGGVSDSFAKLEPLAKALGGMASASRSVVDAGIADRNIQVGQSGKIVSPEVYIALGIYGSLQHLEGLKDVGCIISVNTDKDAPICSLSDLVIEGDAGEFVEKLISKLI